MNREEIIKQIHENKFSKTIRCYKEDELSGLIEELFYDGVREGYKYAIYLLESYHRFPYGMADEYIDENMEKIRRQLELCRMLDEVESEVGDSI